MRFVAYDELKDKGITYSRSQLLRLEKAGRFPHRVPVSDQRIAWVESEIEIWMKSRIENRGGGLPEHVREQKALAGAAGLNARQAKKNVKARNAAA